MTETSPVPLAIDLTPDERLALDEFLASPRFDERAMDLSTLEGFLTAMVIGPSMVMPSKWVPWVWDHIDGRVAPPFEDLDEANAMLGLVMRLYNSLIRRFQTDPEGFRPVCFDGAEWGASEWCEGFLTGVGLDDAWSPLLVGQPAWFRPFFRLGTDEGIRLTMQDEDAELWVDAIAPSLVKIHDFWLQRRQAASHPRGLGDVSHTADARQPVMRATRKVGRNDPCPCGSGKKYKKCCGSTASTLH